MTGLTFDTNIVIDALAGRPEARTVIEEAPGGAWVSRMVWIEVLSKGTPAEITSGEMFLSGFALDEVDAEIGAQAAALRRERPRLKSPDAIILATAQVRGRVLVTRNTKDFPADMPGIRIPYQL